jgi:hypothetical protein
VQIFRRNRNALCTQLCHLVAEMPGVEHHAIADDRQCPAHNARRQQGQLIGLITDHQRMAGIMPALKTDDDISLAGEPVDDLALALIAPLRANHCNIGHG